MARINSNRVLAGITATLITISVLLQACPRTLAQTDTTFTPADRFSIPSYNGTISFGVNGTYAKAALENGIWNFANLRLNGSQLLENFKVSAQNSNVTIMSYRAFNTTTRSARLRYAVEGQGKQTFNIGIDSDEEEGGLHADWSVICNGAFMGEGDGWSIAPDATLIVTGAVGNVTIVHYGFLDAFGGGNSSNLSFYQQHSVAIITVTAVAIAITMAIAIRVKNKEHID